MGALEMSRDHFALFDLVPQFAIDVGLLEQRFRDLQARVHPDKHAHLSDAEQRVAMQLATQANEAFQTLKSPLKRAQYMLHLRGVDPQIERNTAMPTAFLVEQLEYREAVAEARSATDIDALETLQRDLHSEMKGEYATLALELDRADVATDYVEGNLAAAQTVRRLLFKEKLLNEIGDAIEALESV